MGRVEREVEVQREKLKDGERSRRWRNGRRVKREAEAGGRSGRVEGVGRR